MLPNRKREGSPVQNKRSNIKRQKNNNNNNNPLERYYTLDEAKKVLHATIDQEPEHRIYHVDEWNHDFSKIYKPFVVTDRDSLCAQFILDGETHANVKEYYPSNERCPLMFDIEWYYITPTPLSELEKHIGHFVDV